MLTLWLLVFTQNCRKTLGNKPFTQTFHPSPFWLLTFSNDWKPNFIQIHCSSLTAGRGIWNNYLHFTFIKFNVSGRFCRWRARKLSHSPVPLRSQTVLRWSRSFLKLPSNWLSKVSPSRLVLPMVQYTTLAVLPFCIFTISIQITVWSKKILYPLVTCYVFIMYRCAYLNFFLFNNQNLKNFPFTERTNIKKTIISQSTMALTIFFTKSCGIWNWTRQQFSVSSNEISKVSSSFVNSFRNCWCEGELHLFSATRETSPSSLGLRSPGQASQVYSAAAENLAITSTHNTACLVLLANSFLHRSKLRGIFPHCLYWS